MEEQAKPKKVSNPKVEYVPLEEHKKLLALVTKMAHFTGGDNLVLKAGYEPFRPK